MLHFKLTYLYTAAVFVVLAFGLNHVFADTETDSPYPPGNSNYANTAIGKIDCANYGGDNDGDGICDNWEVSTPDPNDNNFVGLRVAFTDPNNPNVVYKYKLACNPSISGDCPSPNQKDVYVELDWMNNHDPDPSVIADVVNAFRNAPTPIYLHIQNGEDPKNSVFSNTGNIQQHFNNVRIYSQNLPGYYVSYVKLKQAYFGTIVERQNSPSDSCPSNSTPSTISASYSYNCLTAKRQVFHYGMFVNKIYNSVSSTEPSPSGWAEIIGNDFFMSLGSFTNGKGSIDEQEGSLMHELGHNLGLWHGGMTPPTGIQDDDNCKPNYLSVMSYTYEFRENADICRPLDFSRSALNTLNENSLTDSAVGSYQYPANNRPPPTGTAPYQPSTCPQSGERPIWFSTPSGTVAQGTTGSTTNDWNQDGINTNQYIQNLNKLGIPGGGCTSTAGSTLSGYNDWANLYFAFQNSGNFNGGTVPAESETNKPGPTKLGIPIAIYNQLPQNDSVEGTGFVADEEPNKINVIPEFGPLVGIIVIVSIISVIAITKRYPGKF